jgi:hypothetical protein
LLTPVKLLVLPPVEVLLLTPVELPPVEVFEFTGGDLVLKTRDWILFAAAICTAVGLPPAEVEPPAEVLLELLPFEISPAELLLLREALF